MFVLQKYLKQSATYKVFSHFGVVLADFLDTLGKIAQIGLHVLKCIFKGEVAFGELLTQCDRFGVSSLPITLSIVGMTSIIVASQVANEMVKQGGGNFVGLLMTILIVREVGSIMSGFAIISMIGSSLASELATMRVTEQVDAIDVLGNSSPLLYMDEDANIVLPKSASFEDVTSYITMSTEGSAAIGTAHYQYGSHHIGEAPIYATGSDTTSENAGAMEGTGNANLVTAEKRNTFHINIKKILFVLVPTIIAAVAIYWAYGYITTQMYLKNPSLAKKGLKHYFWGIKNFFKNIVNTFNI